MKKTDFHDWVLFVISVDNHAFSSAFFDKTFEWLAHKQLRPLFVVGSDLMLYNKFSKLTSESDSAQDWTNLRCQYFNDMTRRIQRSQKRSIFKENYAIRPWNDYCTEKFVDILRFVYLIASVDLTVESLIDEKVDAFVRRQAISSRKVSELTRLSRGYVVEETAMSVHLSANYQLANEFYPGDVGKVVEAVYRVFEGSQFAKRLGLKSHEKSFNDFRVVDNQIVVEERWRASVL